MHTNLIDYTLHLADNAVILGHRNSEWTGHGPVLEQDIAFSNIALDLIGQARNFYQYAAELIGENATEDTLAYQRNANAFKNCLLVEQENGDWGKTILRQFFFSTYQYLLYQRLHRATDKTFSAIAEKSLKEVTYHLRWSSEWVIRLGQGTEESHARMTRAIQDLWMYSAELNTQVSYETALRLYGDASGMREEWNVRVRNILSQAGITVPENIQMIFGGKEGKHTGHLQQLLEEMQYMQRTYPGMEW